MIAAGTRMLVLVMLLGWCCVAAAQTEAHLRAAVEARQTELDAAIAAGELTLRTLPPDEGTVPLAAPIVALVTARARYLSARDADPSTRWDYELANAELMYLHGQVRWALEAYWRVYRESCRVDGNVVERAWTGIAIAGSRTHDDWLIERVAGYRRSEVCLYGERELEARERARIEGGPCAPPLPPGVIGYVGSQPIDPTWHHPVELHQRAEDARRAGRPHLDLYEAAALALLATAEREQDRPVGCRADVSRAVLLAGQALAQAHRPRAAGELFERAIAMVEQERLAASSDRDEVDHLLAAGLFVAGLAARDAGDDALALAYWARLYDDPRLAASTDPEMPSMCLDAMIEASRLLTWLDRHAEAAALLDRVARDDPDPSEARLSALLALEARAALPEVDRRPLIEAARAFLASAELPVELELRALDLLVPLTRGRERREVEARLRSLADALPPPGDDETPAAHHAIAARVEREAAARSRDRAEARRLLDRALARRVGLAETCAALHDLPPACARARALPTPAFHTLE